MSEDKDSIRVLKIANIYRRGLGFIFDEFILSLIRTVILSLIYILFLKENLDLYIKELLELMNVLPENASILDIINQIKKMKITWWIQLSVFLYVIVSPIYQFIMYKKKEATFGKLALNMIVKKDTKLKMTNGDIIARMTWSYIPWLLPFVVYYLFIINSGLWILCSMIWFFWYDPWILFGQRNKAIHDSLSGTCVFVMKKDKESSSK